MDRLWEAYPHATLRPSGEDVGLPAGQMGNSEVGHTNLGAGFVPYQWLTRIDKAVAEGDLGRNPALATLFAHLRRTGGTLHLLGLLSDGGVHSHVAHLEGLLRLAAVEDLPQVAVHVFTDGRDTAPTAGLGFVRDLEVLLAGLGLGRIATVSGRYWAMDRDNRWERTRTAYDVIVLGKGETGRNRDGCRRARLRRGDDRRVRLADRDRARGRRADDDPTGRRRPLLQLPGRPRPPTPRRPGRPRLRRLGPRAGRAESRRGDDDPLRGGVAGGGAVRAARLSSGRWRG
jgi:hypothetical protein